MAVVAVEVRSEMMCRRDEVGPTTELVGWWDQVWIEIQLMFVPDDDGGYFDGEWSSVTLDMAWDHKRQGQPWR